MIATFLCKLDVGSDTDLTSISTEIQEELTASGFNVLEVKPWFRPTLGAQSENTLVPTPPLPGGIRPT